MTFKLKQNFNVESILQDVARERVQDYAFLNLSSKEIDKRAANYLRNQNFTTSLSLRAGRVLDSSQYRTLCKDYRFWIAAFNRQAEVLSNEIQNVSTEAFSVLNDIETQLKILDQKVTEQEFQYFANYNKVHHNAFARSDEIVVDFKNKQWLVDPKTQLPFLEHHICNVYHKSGATLPIESQVQLPVAGVYLEGENTIYGDGVVPVVSSPPVYIVEPGEVFRYVVVKKHFDNTSRHFVNSSETLSVILDFDNITLVNTIEISPIGHSPVVVETIKYWNENNEEIIVVAETIYTDGKTLLLLEPVYARQIAIVFRQHAAVGNTNIEADSYLPNSINKILLGMGWSTFLEENPVSNIQGKVFDFSLKEIKLFLTSYQQIGIYRSPVVETGVVSSLTLATETNNIGIVESGGFAFPETEIHNEYYIGLELFENQAKVLKELVPVVDTKPIQNEMLPIFGGVAKFKLFPDLTWNRKIVVSEVAHTNNSATIKTQTAHFLSSNQDFILFSDGPSKFNFETSAFSILAANEVGIVESFLSAADYDYEIYKAQPIYIYDDSVAPLKIFADGVELVFGTDYQISLDKGSTWWSEVPLLTQYLTSLNSFVAGDFLIRLVNPDYGKTYSCQYKVLANQHLVESQTVSLQNGVVVVKMPHNKALINVVAIMRSQDINPYVTDVIEQYTLKVRSDVL